VSKAYLEPAEVERLEEVALCLRDKLLIRLLFRLGCRISEALGIKVSDIDFTQGTITIEHLKTRVRLVCPHCGGGLSRSSRFCPACGREVGKAVAEGKEHRRFRMLPVDNGTAAVLKEYVKRGGPILKKGHRLLFGISRHRAWQVVMRCAEKAKLPRLVNVQSGKLHNVSPHRLRDAFAVHAVKFDDSGDGLRMLQEHLGHLSITTTMRYRKVSGEEQKEWYGRLWNGGNGSG